MSTTEDPNDPRLGHGSDDSPAPQQAAYLVLPEADRRRGLVRPLRETYAHALGDCGGATTTMGRAIAETYARDPSFYGSTFCAVCRMHRPVAEFVWVEAGRVTDLVVGS